MFQRFHAMREQRDERGFTLIELLVVILIIAILAAIAIPAFLRQREKGWKSQQESALKNAAIAAESFAADNNGSYSPGGTDVAVADLVTHGYNNTTGVTITVDASTDATTYCLVATHGTLGNTTPGTDWGVASYDSSEGAPEADDACTA